MIINTTLINELKETYPNLTIVMASKYIETKDYQGFIDAGIKDFGESRVEAFVEKYDEIKNYPITHHFLGTVQSKKVKQFINHIDCLHSLDRFKLAKEIQKHRQHPLPCFVQVNISKEKQKHGLALNQVADFLKTIARFDKIQVIGLMGMAQLTDDKALIKTQFQRLKDLQKRLSEDFDQLQFLSMGMSNDYEIALDVGATHLRLGRILFGGS